MAAIRQGPEAACAAVIATLTTNVNAAVDDIWSVWTGHDAATDLAPPKVYPKRIYRFGRDLIPNVNYPVIEVSWAGSQQVTNHMTTIPGASSYDQERHRLYVAVGQINSDKYVLEAQVTRLVWAVRTVLLKYPLLDGTLGGYGGGLTIGALSNGPAIAHHSDSKLLQKWAGVEVFLDVDEVIQ